MPVDELLPAIAQGAIGIEALESRDDLAAFLAPIHCAESAARITVERAFLRALDGSCRTPIAGLAVISEAGLEFRGEVLRPDGSERLSAGRQGGVSDGEAMGRDAAEELLAQGARRSSRRAGF